MKKIKVLFFLIAVAVPAAYLTFSCNSAVSDEFGTLILDFGGGSRAIGADGLPILDKSTIRVQGRGEISGSFSQDFLSAEGVSLSFPVGDTVELKVSVMTPSARWSSPPLRITMEPGTNAVGVKLSKKTAAFHNFLFTRHLGTGIGSYSSFTLKLEDGTDILSNVQTHAGSLPAFVRNGKGGIYVVYAEPSYASIPQFWKMFFYDSEGKNRREVILPSVHRARNFIPASDFITGQIYAASVPDSGSGKLYRLGTDGVSGDTNLDCSGGYAVDNNRLVRIDRTSGTVLELYTDISQAFTGTHANPSRKNISSDIQINGTPLSAVQDICIRGDYIYLLFSVSESGASQDGNGGYYSAGGLLRYKIIQGANALEIGNAERFGFDSAPQFTTVSFPQIPGSSIKLLTNYDYKNRFYSPVRFIGFDEDKLYIADDGLASSYTAGGGIPLRVENRDRIAAFNGETGSLSFENTPAETKWLLAAQEESSSPFSYVKVDYNNLGQYLAYTASSTAVNYIEIVGTIPITDFTGTGSNPGEFGKKIKAEGSKKIALKLPERVAGLTDIRWCFKDCANLVSLANIPESVTNMQGCFEDCTALTQAPVIPTNVKEMESCFKNCTSLTQGPDIPASVEKMTSCFEDCTKLEGVKLECDYKSASMGSQPFSAAFNNCTALQAGGIKVPSGQLQTYRDNASVMGTDPNKFAAF